MPPPKQLKLTELFGFRGVAQRNVKRKLEERSPNVKAEETKEKRLHVSPEKVGAVEELGCENIVASVSLTPIGQHFGKHMDEKAFGSPSPDKSAEFVPSHPLLSTLPEPGWCSLLCKEFGKEYVKEICRFLEEQDKKGVSVFPPRHLIFNAFNLTPFDKIRVIILGQDPYHNLRQAHGLCFSVPSGEPKPPSLKNIYKELASEYSDFKIPEHGTLTKWAIQGVFLLNATLTVEAHRANSHSQIGWQKFTDAVIKLISERSKLGNVFILWGGFAHKKEALIDAQKHRIIKAAHPSPLSAHRFLGCKCFSRANDALAELGREPINWTDL